MRIGNLQAAIASEWLETLYDAANSARSASSSAVLLTKIRGTDA